MTNKELFDALKAPFKPEDVEWRVGRKTKDKSKGEVLAYISARAVQERLDEVVGADKWSVEYTPVDFGDKKRTNYKGEVEVTSVKGFLATLTINLPEGYTVQKTDGANCTDFEPFKGGISGAFRRVGSAFGIGRYLYSLPAIWVELDQWGNFKKPNLPSWALPEGVTQESQSPVQQHHGSEDTPATQASNGEVIFPKGKYAGKPVSSVTDMGYLSWVADRSNFSEDIKQAASKVIADQQMNMYDEPA